MDSPKTDKITSTTIATTTTSSSDSVAIQDSPIFSYISNLSPIKPVKAAPVAPGFLGLNSPPIVFTSPHVNPIRERNYLKRLQYPESSSAELSLQDDRDQKIASGPDISGKFNTQSNSGLTPCTEKEVDNKGPMEDKAGSPSGCVDEYLTDAVEVESANLTLKQSDDGPQSLNSFTNSKESISEHGNKNDIRKDEDNPVAFPTILERAEEDLQGKSSFYNIKTVDIDGKQGSGEIPSCFCPNIDSNLSTGRTYEEQYCDHSLAQHAGAGCKDGLDLTSQFQPDSLEIIREHEDCQETSASVSNEPAGNMILIDPEVSQHHRGIRRRCLQFEEGQQNIIANSPGSWKSSNNVTGSRSPPTPTDSEVLESSCMEISAISGGRQMVNLTQPINSMISPRKCGNSTFIMSKPSGIGLHLNSIVNAMPMGCGATASLKSTEKGYLNIKGMKSVSIRGCHLPENTKNSSISSNVIDKVSASTEDGSHETPTSVGATSATSQSPQIVKPLNNTVQLELIEYRPTPYDKSKSSSARAETVEELNKLNPKKKRKKASGTSDGDGDGCKRCNCKKTKCLKLYCDCFAAGIYCAEPCACQGCFNRPEYEDTVLETRQQIESRNPIAFAPKIVQRVTESPANSSREDGNCLTPSSAKHKRGCNCKKSMCLKKYCECYQANVGCSDGCRCEGCKNVYGRKEEYSMAKDVVNKRPIDERLEGGFDVKLEMAATRNGFVQTELCDPHSLTPLTPSFQCSDHGKDASKSRFASRRYIQSPESDLALLPPYGKSVGSPRNSDNHDLLLKTRKDILDLVSCHQELDYDIAETVDEFSPRCDGIANICRLTMLPDPPTMAMASLTSTKKRDWENVSRDQLCPGGDHFSSVSSLRWRSSPITPMPQLGSAKLLQVLDSDNKLYDILEDDTPEILKDTSTPLSAMKVSSPNKKRVSPPHGRLHEHGSSSSAGLRSGRKFILQAVPSFPPLTPCIDLKDISNQNINDPQDCSSNK